MIARASLSPGAIAALGSLIGLAGAVGLGALLTQFLPRKAARSRSARSGAAIFELFVVAALLGACGATVVSAVSLLLENKSLSSREATEVAMPLAVAVITLVLLSVIARVPSSLKGSLTALGMAGIGTVVAALIGAEAWLVSPGSASLAAIALLVVAGGVGLSGWWLERDNLKRTAGAMRRRRWELAAAGYVLEQRLLGVAVPQPDHMSDRLTLPCWMRDGDAFLDAGDARMLGADVRRRWESVASGETPLPVAELVLAEVVFKHGFPLVRPHAYVAIEVDDFRYPPNGRPQRFTRESNDDGLFRIGALGARPAQEAKEAPRAELSS